MTADEVFQDQCFLWEREASIGSDFITFKIMEAQTKKARYVSFKLDSGCSVRFIISTHQLYRIYCSVLNKA